MKNSYVNEVTGKEIAAETLEAVKKNAGTRKAAKKLSCGGKCSQEAKNERLDFLESAESVDLGYVSGEKKISDTEKFAGNIENFIGTAQVPVGVAGPLKVNGREAKGEFYVPLATTEGAMVISYNRGAHLLSKCGGVDAMVVEERVTRVPGFGFASMKNAYEFISWVMTQEVELKQAAKTRTKHGELKGIKPVLQGDFVYLTLEYTTGDAAGQNMVTMATEAVCGHIISNCPVEIKKHYVEINMSGDKKASYISLMGTRGRRVCAEAVIQAKYLKKYMNVTPGQMAECWKMGAIGGVISGTIGVNCHYANGLAALFIACGQDAACVAEAAVGVTRMELNGNGDLYVSVTLPNMITGTVGGGTKLPTQKECLELMGCSGEGKANKFAEIAAALIMAGELSITGAMAAGEFAQAHEKYGRSRK